MTNRRQWISSLLCGFLLAVAALLIAPSQSRAQSGPPGSICNIYGSDSAWLITDASGLYHAMAGGEVWTNVPDPLQVYLQVDLVVDGVLIASNHPNKGMGDIISKDPLAPTAFAFDYAFGLSSGTHHVSWHGAFIYPVPTDPGDLTWDIETDITIP